MIAFYDLVVYRNTLLEQAYTKAQTLVNHYAVRPQPTDFPIEMEFETDSIDFIDFVPALLTRFYTATNRDYLEEDTAAFVRTITDNVEESMFIECPRIYHFGLYLDNYGLLTPDERIEFADRIKQMTDAMSGTGFVSFMDFYDNYFKNNFFGSNRFRPESYQERLDYTYLMYADVSNHNSEDFGPIFMGKMAEFARSYAEFYDDLNSIISKREGGRLDQAISSSRTA